MMPFLGEGKGVDPPEEYKFHPYRTTKEMKLPKFSLNPIQAFNVHPYRTFPSGRPA
jgi:hypothetical protein